LGDYYLKKGFNNGCLDEKDVLYHLMEEQIAHICVLEEEEQEKQELKNQSNMHKKDISKN
jgi:hypothetical protein